MTDKLHKVVVWDRRQKHELAVPHGTNLRLALLEVDLTPYSRVTQHLNCGGRGLCATCGVYVEGAPDPAHWHDALAARFGYPRLSCQLMVDRDLVVRLVSEKLIWGGRAGNPTTPGASSDQS